MTAYRQGFACEPHRKEAEARLYAVHDGRSSPSRDGGGLVLLQYGLQKGAQGAGTWKQPLLTALLPSVLLP